MNASKRKFNGFMREKETTKALFDHEVETLFYEFREWAKDAWNKPPNGVTLKIFKKWLTAAGYVLVIKRKKK